MATPTDGKRVYRRLLQAVRPYWLAFTLAIFGNILYAAVDAGLVKLLEPLLNEGFVARNETFIRWIPVVVLGIFTLRGLATFLSTFFMGWVGRTVVMNFRRALYDKYLHLPHRFYDNHSSGELLSRITFNVEQVADACTDALTVLVRESFTAIGLLIVMLSISVPLTLLFLVALPLMAVVMHLFSKRLRKYSGRVQVSMADVTHAAEETIEGHQVVKVFTGQSKAQALFDKITADNRHQEMRHITTSAISIPIIQILGACALAGTIWLATADTPVSNSISPGAFAAMISSMLILLKPIKQLTKVNATIQRGIAGAASIFELLDQPAEEDNGHTALDKAEGNIVFNHVSFTYPFAHGKGPVLQDISFTVEKGETVAIVGRSGGGKSTLVGLVPRFYDCEGEILIDGIGIKEIPLQQLRHNIAVVSQNITLFNETIGYNIAYGAPFEVDAQAVRDAAASAFLLPFIDSLPNGFDTLVGENGVRLSGGQRQRIAIARAIIKKAPILILDEATSALDTESERHIQAALDSLMKRCTTLVIAHRLSTIENADKILVMEGGRILEMGTHDALLEKGGAYVKLRRHQFDAVT
jgi:subfamily B ATP-binding cassette protein MsbA